ncbi:hybrid sensor histidine kinase/response regulator [Archangium lansingense]|uniref:histidine kinase n=1 Tax=Archangium lansingense TaxID=2995310 RepID=A0ABT4APP1_9BACT|nr:hybrid sensor histidine kinase/response regulator [Archangium lansinium]MCY1082762.1 hybrid sensor histidine kinase/response regulator [Archangium lansinium]
MQAGNAPRTSVLLVDDQPADLLAMERHLGPFSLHLVKACSGEEALHCIEDEDFALVLMDVRMPGLDGFETARLMRENAEQSHVPLIFLTGAPPEEHNLAYASGAVDWLRKPVEPEILRAKVRVFVELHRERETLRRQQAELREREREALEEQRLRVEAERERLVVELREAVRLRDEFLSVASHELRTPLTPLALRLQLMWQGLEAETPDVERLRGHVEVARGQVRRMASLVESLLDTTRITRGRLPLRREREVNLATIVRGVAVGFETQAARAGCAVEMETPTRVTGEWDVLRLEQVVTHLLSNALKFGAGGPVLLRVEEQEGWARLTVRDAGIGMDEKVRARIFGRFERGVSERHYGGLGLGLFITHQAVEAMGGRIHVESAPGRGSTFTVELPCSAPKEAGGGTHHDA